MPEFAPKSFASWVGRPRLLVSLRHHERKATSSPLGDPRTDDDDDALARPAYIPRGTTQIDASSWLLVCLDLANAYLCENGVQPLSREKEYEEDDDADARKRCEKIVLGVEMLTKATKTRDDD